MPTVGGKKFSYTAKGKKAAKAAAKKTGEMAAEAAASEPVSASVLAKDEPPALEVGARPAGGSSEAAPPPTGEQALSGAAPSVAVLSGEAPSGEAVSLM